MLVYIIGYRWCKHFQNAVKLLSKFDPILIIVPSETPNRALLLQKVRKIIEGKSVIHQPAPTSPQIILQHKATAICVPGETELKSILKEKDLKTFCMDTVQCKTL